MRMDEEKLNLYQKMALIRKSVDVVKKNKKGFNYKYTSIEDILAKVTVSMEKYNVSLIPRCVSGTSVVSPYNYQKTKIDKTGKQYEEQVNEIIVQTEVLYTWINNDNPTEFIEVPWFVVGSQADPAQALGSGLTYGQRQFLINYFQIAQPEDDVDSYRAKQRAAEEEQEALIAQAITEEIHTAVTGHLENHPKDRAKITEIVKKYDKKSNYFNIKSPKEAAKLLEELKEVFEEKEENNGV